jgi:hypothetical protein
MNQPRLFTKWRRCLATPARPLGLPGRQAACSDASALVGAAVVS